MSAEDASPGKCCGKLRSGREGGKGLAPLDRPFRRLDNSQSISVTLAELSSDGADYVSMEGYGFFRRNLVPTTRNGTVTKVRNIPPWEPLGLPSTLQTQVQLRTSLGQMCLALGWLQGLQTISSPLSALWPCLGHRLLQQLLWETWPMSAVLRYVRSAAGNRGVWAGGTQVLLTANEQMSPGMGPIALKIRSLISEFVAANNATLAGIGGGRLAAATRMWAICISRVMVM